MSSRHFPSVFCVLSAAFGCANAGAAEVPLHRDTVVRFATVEEGVAALTKRDGFIESLSRFDLQSRLRTDQAVSRDDLLKFIANQVIAWDEQDVKQLTSVIESIRERLKNLHVPLPETVLLVHTTGKEEGEAAYCRGNAIVLPAKVLQRTRGSLERLLIHELFHVVSSHNAELRQQLYNIVGFRLTDEIELPESLRHRKITNPDAPLVNCYIELDNAGERVKAAPILYSSVEQYDAQQGGTFFRFLRFRLMVLEEKDGQLQAAERDGEPVLFDPKVVDSFFDQIGRNTKYIIHPDEILADNFIHLVMKSNDLETPRIVEQMGKLFGM